MHGYMKTSKKNVNLTRKTNFGNHRSRQIIISKKIFIEIKYKSKSSKHYTIFDFKKVL